MENENYSKDDYNNIINCRAVNFEPQKECFPYCIQNKSSTKSALRSIIDSAGVITCCRPSTEAAELMLFLILSNTESHISFGC